MRGNDIATSGRIHMFPHEHFSKGISTLIYLNVGRTHVFTHEHLSEDVSTLMYLTLKNPLLSYQRLGAELELLNLHSVDSKVRLRLE
jgi:hypothetical protein